MKRALFTVLCLFCCIFFNQKLHAQDVSANYRIAYYYRLPDTGHHEHKEVILNKKMVQFMAKANLIFVDSITFIPETQNGYDSIWSANPHLHTDAFFVHRTEVSNAEYKTFLANNAAPAYYPDTMVWKAMQEENHPYIHYYFQHTAYSNYPVVGINHWQAEQFCKWKATQLNDQLKKTGITGYQIEVSLPSEDQWQAVFYVHYTKWLAQLKKPCVLGPTALNSRAYVLGCNGYRANFGVVQTQRLENLKLPLPGASSLNAVVSPCTSYPSVFGIYNLFGNVAEWTATSAKGTLYNHLEYIYTATNRIIPNTISRIDSAALSKRLHAPSVMAEYYAVKGGSWEDDIYYLQPCAMQFHQRMYRSSKIGFRYVATIKRL